MSLPLEVADAVVKELAGHPFSQAFIPTRRVLPDFTLPDLKTLRVSVVPKSIRETVQSRSTFLNDVLVDIGVQKAVSRDLDTEVAELLDLVDEIAVYMRGRVLADFPEMKWVATANEPIYAQEHLLESRVFTSVLTLTYQAVCE